MPRFSTLGAMLAAPALAATLATAGCDASQPSSEISNPAPQPASARVASPVDPGDEGTARNLLQHYRARDLVGGRMSIPSGRKLHYESGAWQIPFQSKRMIAALLTTVARDEAGELSATLAPHATFGAPDARRPHARPIFAGDNTDEFLRRFRNAAERFDAQATYNNPSNFQMGIQEVFRTGAEPMWAFYENGLDRILFRFRVHRGLAVIDYVGFYDDAPTEAIDYSALGPERPMTPPMRREDGRVLHNFNGRDSAVQKRIDPAAAGTPRPRRAPPKRPVQIP